MNFDANYRISSVNYSYFTRKMNIKVIIVNLMFMLGGNDLSYDFSKVFII